MPSLFFYSGLSFIISDLNIFPIVYEYHIGRSYLPGMDALIVHFLIWPKIIETKRSAYITLSLLLCILAFSLNIFGTQDFGVSLFQALLLLLVIYYGTIDFPNITKIDRESDYLPDSMLSDKENEPLNKPTTGFESIFSAINGAILVLLEAYESSEQKSRDFINQTITNLRKAINTLTKTNIYSSSFDIVTKNMDEQDKIFISQTFFEKPAIKPHSLSSKGDFKEKLENTLGVSELLGILRQIGKE